MNLKLGKLFFQYESFSKFLSFRWENSEDDFWSFEFYLKPKDWFVFWFNEKCKVHPWCKHFTVTFGPFNFVRFKDKDMEEHKCD